MKFNRGPIATSLAAGTTALGALAVVFTSTPAQAIPTLPTPSPQVLNVYSFYDSPNGKLVGQRWNGCGDAPGSWGIQTSHGGYNTAPCG
ncbi:hypothetical protein Aple_072420 [Acrocarpospora pleiomorpha]|uniref:Uncharacterized protein n=1 Tax=Acrocarpospora pleiomorpha TaxID=90975 RepID=A0A5M3XY18_9ACTN|nr:DUF6289 family protein [Acrocarpospora pleiomorpha]GES24343.1 hypothetical protein Aple_072420 [Acrocarpospora pleiomorpha]